MAAAPTIGLWPAALLDSLTRGNRASHAQAIPKHVEHTKHTPKQMSNISIQRAKTQQGNAGGKVVGVSHGRVASAVCLIAGFGTG